jgi:peptidyl-prolyl cis-trans isomerase SurA
MMMSRQPGWMKRAGGAAVLVLGLSSSLFAQVAPVATPSQASQSNPLNGSSAAPALPSVATPKPSVAPSDAVPTVITAPVLPAMPAVRGTEFDRVVAIVNGDLILDSDVDQERRFSALLPYGEAGGAYSREKAIERLINRKLILQQSKLQPQDPITDEDAEKDLASLRKELPACKVHDCETKAGWDNYLASEGFTEAGLLQLWKQRMEVLAFIERRFKQGVKISQDQIKTYYEKTLLPLYAAQHATAPPVDAISERIQEVLLQQQVSNLLSDWLQSLRAQGSVVVLHPGEEAP